MYEFFQLNTQETNTTSFHVIKDCVPVALLSNHKGGLNRPDAVQTWTLYRLCDFTELETFSATTEEAKVKVQQIVIEVPPNMYLLQFTTAFGLTLYTKKRQGNVLTPHLESALVMSINECGALFFQEDNHRPLSSPIPGDWFVSCQVVNARTHQALKRRELNETLIRPEYIIQAN